MQRVLYVNNFEAPYRVPFYNLLAEEFDLTMAFSDTTLDQSERNKKWFYQGTRKYQVVQLRSRKIFGKRISFEILKYIKHYDLIFMDMYSNPTNLLAIAYLKFSKQRFVMSVDGMLKHPNESWLSVAVKRWLLRTPQYILSPSEYVDECLEKYGVDRDKLVRYHFTSLLNSDILAHVPTHEEKQLLREKLNIRGGGKVILSVGRFSYMNGYGKGYDVLLRAFAQCSKEYQLLIIGDEPTVDFLEQKHKLGLNNLQFVGFKSKEELREYYQAADLFCLQSRGDTWGLVINEAMSQGLPVISSDLCVAGLDLVEEGVNGYIVPVENADMLAKRIRHVLSNDEKWKKMAQCSLERIQEYTIQNMVQKHADVFRKTREYS